VPTLAPNEHADGQDAQDHAHGQRPVGGRNPSQRGRRPRQDEHVGSSVTVRCTPWPRGSRSTPSPAGPW